MRAKKDFGSFEDSIKKRKNPVESILAPSAMETGQPDENSGPDRAFPEDWTETKSVRAHLLLRPATKAEIKKLADFYHTSFNGLVCMILEEYIRNHKQELEERGERA